jgi:mono/diheme cytochrome c family protein
LTKVFVALSALLIALVGIAAAKDSHDRSYLSIQDQYKADYPSSNFDTKAQQLFPAFPASQQGQTFRVERCISCHVPDIAVIGPQVAAQRLVQDFMKYEPNYKQIAQANGLKLVHPALITQELYDQYGADSFATTDGFHPYQVPSDTNPNVKETVKLPGPIPAFLSPAANGGKPLGIDQVGCISCHNGGRLALDDTAAHTNLIINPEYSFTEGAALYYQNCAACHGNLGQGKVGPPLNNQDRLGYFNEDYYYRCIEYGYTDFEHVGSVMPVWGSQAPDWTYGLDKDGKINDPKTKPIKRQLSEDQINLLVQFIRHWENYSTLP